MKTFRRHKGALVITVVAILLGISGLVYGGGIREVVSQTTNTASGYLGLPGAPRVNLLWAFLWAVVVGWVFSTVGAFGGIMAGLGHISLFGLGDYARAFSSSNPELNHLLTDSIRVSNQWLVGLSALVASFRYYRMGRLVLPLGLALACGSVTGSYLVPVLSAGKINLSQYLGYFGLCVFVIAGFLFYETTAAGQARKKNARQAARAFEQDHMKDRSQGVRITHFRLTQVRFLFYGVQFSFNPLVAAIGGFFIACLASFLGIGGGFLFVPYLSTVAGLPMFLVAGTSAVAVLVGMVVSIFSYMVLKGSVVYWPMIGAELLGIATGSVIGPWTSKYIPEVWLKRLFVLFALYVGIRYTTKGFLGHSILPPY
jgi:uncharacterized membrane protein YfcA